MKRWIPVVAALLLTSPLFAQQAAVTVPWNDRIPPGTADHAARALADWMTVFEGSDACVSPVLGLEAAPDHPYHRERGSFVTVDGIPQPAPAPRFARTPGRVQGPVPAAGQHNDDALADWGFDAAAIADLKAAGAL